MTSAPIIVPVFNGEHILKETLASLAAQTKSDDEIIIIDDGSIDSIFALADEFEESVNVNVRVTPLTHCNPSYAPNYSIDEEWEEFLDFLSR